MNPSQRIHRLTLDEGSIIRRTPEVEHERAVAIADLLEANCFAPRELPEGPFALHLMTVENRLAFDITPEGAQTALRIMVPLAPFRSVIKDYFMICESYFDAIKNASPSRIEAIDMGRRGIHNEGSQLLSDLLKERVELDFETARRLFTLICVLHIK